VSAVVKAVKELVTKLAHLVDLSSVPVTELLDFLKTPHDSGPSPAQIVFGYQLRFIIPAHWSLYASKSNEAIAAGDRKVVAEAVVSILNDALSLRFPSARL
jgi:hypothetical protein